MIDEEVRKFVEDGEATARKIITEGRSELDIISAGLLEHETLSRDDIEALLRGETIDRSEKAAPKARDLGRRTSVPTSGASGRPTPGFGQEPTPQPGG